MGMLHIQVNGSNFWNLLYKKLVGVHEKITVITYGPISTQNRPKQALEHFIYY